MAPSLTHARALTLDPAADITHHRTGGRGQDVRIKAKRREIYGELKDLRRELRAREEAAVHTAIHSAQVVLSTLSGAASRKLERLDFDYVCIDEVSQALEAEAWIAASKARIIRKGKPPPA